MVVHYQWDKIEQYRKRMLDSGMSDANKKSVLEFDSCLRGRDCSISNRSQYFYHLMKWAEFFGKPWLKITKEDFLDYRDHLLKKEGRSYYAVTRIFIRIKAFFKWLNDGELPDSLKEIKFKKPVSQRVDPRTLLSKEEILKLVENAGSVRNKAIVYALWESNLRIGEFLDIKVGDIYVSDSYVTISFRRLKKAGMQPKVEEKVLIESAPLVIEWLDNYHPYGPKKKDAYLWCGEVGKPTNSLQIQNVNQMLYRAKERAGIDKPVSAHRLRHSRNSYHAKTGKNYEFIRIDGGWEKGSPMPHYYTHLDEKHVKDVLLREAGLLAEKEEEKPLAPVKCPRCKELNLATADYCKKCWFVLDPEKAVEAAKIQRQDTEAVMAYMQEMRKDISQVYKRLDSFQKMKDIVKGK